MICFRSVLAIGYLVLLMFPLAKPIHAGNTQDSTLNLSDIYAPDVDKPEPYSQFVEGGLNWQKEVYFGMGWRMNDNWQIGTRLESSVLLSNIPFEQLPRFSFWGKYLLKGENESASNAEYFLCNLGFYNGYGYKDLDSLTEEILLGGGQRERLWFQPFIALGVGKYWQPFSKIPWGLDIGIEFERTFRYAKSLYGKAPRRRSANQVTLVLQIFYAWNTH